MDQSKDSYQIGKGFATNLLTLGVPIGLSIAANKLNSKNITKKNKPKKVDDQDGGFLEKNLILEAGLSVVPFGLISALEYFDNKPNNTKKTSDKDKN